MPRMHSGREYAAQFTQAYRQWDGTDKQLKNNDARSVENLFYALDYHMDESKEEKSPELVQLHKDVTEFRRQLRECANKLNENGYNRDTLEADQASLGKLAVAVSLGMKSLKGNEAKLVEKYKKEWEDLGIDKTRNILHNSGEIKAASKWIDDIKRKWEQHKDEGLDAVTKEEVATVLAARQLANAKFGKRANIDNNKISSAELKNQTARLMASPEFKAFYEKEFIMLDYKTVTHGHGGKLERSFENFLVENAKVVNLEEFDQHGRYAKLVNPVLQAQADWVNVDYEMAGVQDPKTPKVVSTPSDYKNYSEYISKNSGVVAGAKIVAAAKMAAAGTLASTKPEANFDKKTFDKQTAQYMKDSAFRLAVADPDSMDKLVKGDITGFNDDFEVIKAGASNLLDIKDEFRIDGEPFESLERLEEQVEQGNTDLKPVTEGVRSLMEGPQTPEKVMEVLGNIVKYQDAHAMDNHGPKGKALNDSLRLMHELTQGSPYLNSLVDKQIDKVNEARGMQPKDHNFLTKDFIAKEGIETRIKTEKELGIIKEADQGMIVEEPDPVEEKLNTAMDLGHGKGMGGL